MLNEHVASSSAGTMTEVRRILFINVTRIGDTLLSVPALRAIAKAYPDARIDCLGHPKRIEVLANLSYVSSVGGITKKNALFRGWLDCLSGRHSYDLAFVFGFDEPLVAYALRVSCKVVAFRQKNENLNHKLFRLVEVPPFQSEHAVNQLLHLPLAVGIQSAGFRLDYRVTKDESAAARQRLVLAMSGDASPLIGLQVASFPTKAYRDWPIEHFIQLVDAIRCQWPNAYFLIFGGSEEKERTERLADYLGSAGTLYAGRLSLRETVAMMSLTDIYVGVDTGPTHLMSALDIPMIGLYHCHSPSHLIGPLEHPKAFLVDHPRADGSCSIETPMAEISVETVLGRLTEALTKFPPKFRS